MRLDEGRCQVCGLRTSETICPRCATVIIHERAICPRCGKIFNGPVARCDACGAEIGERADQALEERAIRSFMLVPGIDERRARDLYERGFRDFSDILKLALPSRAVRQGLHHTISRKLMLASLLPKKRLPPGEEATMCPVCHIPTEVSAGVCQACGSRLSLDVSTEEIKRKLRQVTGEIYSLSSDPDFKGMPKEMRDDLLAAFAGWDQERLLREEFQQQIDAWREKGFETSALERLLDDDLEAFREKSVRIIRAQIMKRLERGKYKCPLCEVVLRPEVEVCDNCGARFA